MAALDHPMPQLTLLSPLGELTLSEDGGAIVALDWGRGRDQTASPLLAEAVAQLQDYFDGLRRDFDLPLAPHGTDFQRRVWTALRGIPPAHTRSYGTLARDLGSSARAVGQANGSNPIPILIPCHRVLAAGGSLGGYSGGDGPATKRWLLDHERRAYGSPSERVPELPLGDCRTGQRGTMLR
jgi:methylated-DNA-[protein]-cysteine S-methyltransferase